LTSTLYHTIAIPTMKTLFLFARDGPTSTPNLKSRPNLARKPLAPPLAPYPSAVQTVPRAPCDWLEKAPNQFVRKAQTWDLKVFP